MNGFRFLGIAAAVSLGFVLIQSASAVNIGLLAPRNIFLADEDPVNNPDDKEFILETTEVEEPGIFWYINYLEQELGHTVNIYNAGSDDPVEVETNNDIVIISEAISSSQAAADYAVTDKPLMVMEVYILDDMGFSSANVGFTGRAHSSQIKITNPNHPITQGLPETFAAGINDPLTSEPAILTFGSWTAGALSAGEELAVLPTADIGDDSSLRTNTPILLAVEANSSVGNIERWVIFGFSDETPEDVWGGNPEMRTMNSLSPQSLQLFKQTIDWLLGNEPASIEDWSLN